MCEHEGAEATLPSFKIQTNVMDVNKMVGTCRNVENEMEPMLIFFFPANNTKNDVCCPSAQRKTCFVNNTHQAKT